MVTATQLLALPSAQEMGNKLQDVAAVIYGEGHKTLRRYLNFLWPW